MILIKRSDRLLARCVALILIGSVIYMFQHKIPGWGWPLLCLIVIVPVIFGKVFRPRLGSSGSKDNYMCQDEKSMLTKKQPPHFHYLINEGEYKGYYTAWPVTGASQSYINGLEAERMDLIKAGHSVI